MLKRSFCGPPLLGSSPVSCEGTRFSSTFTVSVGFYGELLAQRLESVAVIRNTLAHNRAISDESITILQGDLSVVRAAVERFKTTTVYGEEPDLGLIDDYIPEDDIPEEDLFEFLFVFEDL
jgi:hypothetical protein